MFHGSIDDKLSHTLVFPLFFLHTQLEGDLLAEEFSDIWDKAPKFPDVETSDERIDVDSFVQVYRDIDDLFDNEDADEAASEEAKAAPPASEVKSESNDVVDEDEGDEEDETLEAELESIYESLCDKNGLISKDALRAWEEVGKLLEDGLLGEDEFEDLWAKTQKSPGSSEELDVNGFLSFNVALDGLFDFADDEMMEDDDEEPIDPSATVTETREMVEGESLSSRALFAALADSNGLVGKGNLKRWSELEDMLADGDLLPLELENMFASVAKSAQDASKLDESGFVALYQTIEDLFENAEEINEVAVRQTEEPSGPAENALKQELLDILKDVSRDSERLACGLECTERERRQILTIITELESVPTNVIRQKRGAVSEEDLAGAWDLLYSSSAAMKFNKGLSGLGGSFPNGKFGGLKQTLQTSKFTTDVEYIERIDVTPSSASFDVKVTGDWDLRTSVSIFTGEPSLVMTVEPGRVTYGPTSTRADHWKSLGPLNMLDVSYLDDDLRIMRGNTSIETVFVFRRSF
jgi:hypothetical protein